MFHCVQQASVKKVTVMCPVNCLNRGFKVAPHSSIIRSAATWVIILS